MLFFNSLISLQLKAEPQWPSGIQHCTRHTGGCAREPSPMPVDTSASMWIKKAWLPCWPLYSQQVLHQRWIWGSHKWENMQKGIYPGFETQGRHHQKSKTGVSVAPRKGLMPFKNLIKIKSLQYSFSTKILFQYKRNWKHDRVTFSHINVQNCSTKVKF